ncbi:MAG: hypothetical protein HY720_22100 [Planctomycetes bacterium]|nr:hypothetical protein [Planctomycetota bacterium]
MLLEDLVFQEVVRAATALLYLTLFALAILFCLAKLPRYHGMLLGVIGCLGLSVLLLAEYLGGLPPIVSRVSPRLATLTIYSATLLEAMKPYYFDGARFVLFACLVAGLAGRFKAEKGAVEAEIDRMMGEGV